FSTPKIRRSQTCMSACWRNSASTRIKSVTAAESSGSSLPEEKADAFEYRRGRRVGVGSDSDGGRCRIPSRRGGQESGSRCRQRLVETARGCQCAGGRRRYGAPL